MRDHTKWAAVVARDARADGSFVYAVASTGVYCRPSCPSRPKRRANVSFFKACADAEAAGFRACKRCKPNTSAANEIATLISAICRYIQTHEGASLKEIASFTQLSPFHLHRTFKAWVGLTPKEYADLWRDRTMRRELRKRASVTEAIYSTGYSSSSRFYERSSRALGMNANAFRRGGKEMRIFAAVAPCSLGSVLVAATPTGICAILLGNKEGALRRELVGLFPNATHESPPASFNKTVARVVALVETPQRAIELPLDIRGTTFQMRVWKALQSIPAGKTKSYAEIAKAIGAPTSARAVGSACAKNQIAVAIPCHRAVASSGKLAGYRWGIDRKRELLRREKNELTPPAGGGPTSRDREGYRGRSHLRS